MNVDITGRHVDITPELRAFTEDRLRKLERLLDGPLEIHVVLGTEKHRHRAEIQVKSRTAVLSGMEETVDLHTSIREVAGKLERQALKHKEKVTGRKRRVGTSIPVAAAAIEAEAEAEAEAAAPESESAARRVVRSQRYQLKPLAVEDALIKLEENDEEILVYRDSQSDRVSVIYRRRDGDIGLIEPEF